MLGDDQGQNAASAEDADDGVENSYAREFARTFSHLEHRPMLVIDRTRRVKWCCDRSHALLDKPLPLCVRSGRLIVEDELAPGRFDEFLASLGRMPRRFLVRGRQNSHWVLLWAWRSARDESEIHVFCNLSVPHCDVEKSGIAEDFGLTKAETAVLSLFAHLMSPKEIAVELGVSLSTVRSHIKQIYAKTSVQTGVQLHQLVSTYCAA